MKSIFKSKTVVIGVISIIVGVLTWIQGQVGAGAAITVEGMIMVILRLITSEQLFIKGKNN